MKQPGDLNLEVIRRLVDDILIVSEQSIEEAIELFLSIEKTVTEGAGAATLAAVLSNPDIFRGMKTALILSGANIDSRILASVLMRRLVSKGRIVRFLVEIDDSPGTLSDVSEAIGEFGGNLLRPCWAARSVTRTYGGPALSKESVLAARTALSKQKRQLGLIGFGGMKG